MKSPIILFTSLALFTALAAPSKAEESLSYTGALPPDKAPPLSWGKDPFIAPAVKHDIVTPGMKLTAVFYNPANPSAIINDKIVYKGSIVNGQKVIDIGRTHVILQGETGNIRLDISGNPEPPDGPK